MLSSGNSTKAPSGGDDKHGESAGSQHDEDYLSNLKETQGKAGRFVFTAISAREQCGKAYANQKAGFAAKRPLQSHSHFYCGLQAINRVAWAVVRCRQARQQLRETLEMTEVASLTRLAKLLAKPATKMTPTLILLEAPKQRRAESVLELPVTLVVDRVL